MRTKLKALLEALKTNIHVDWDEAVASTEFELLAEDTATILEQSTPNEKISSQLIKLANDIASYSFMDYPDYDKDEPITSLAGAITIFVQESMRSRDEIELSEVYDEFDKLLG